MLYKIEIVDKSGIFDGSISLTINPELGRRIDAVGAGVKKGILDLGITGVEDVSFIQVYNIEGDISEPEVRKICEELLTDRISQEYVIMADSKNLYANRYTLNAKNEFSFEVAYNPGVMDPVEESVLKGVRDLGIFGVSSVRTAKKYVICGKLTFAQQKLICDKLLYNKLIQHIVSEELNPPVPPFFKGELGGAGYQFKLVTVDLLSASNKRLLEISALGQLFLNLEEMLQIQRYFKTLKRNPTDCELETVAQTWSEHCYHKTFRGKIEYAEKVEGHKSQVTSRKLKVKSKTKIINNLLKSTIMKATKELKKPWCVSVFKDNAGIIEFDEKNNICFKVETHNHPSALEPFGGSNTGIGGVIRDVMGTGLSAKPILNTDVFCFAPPDFDADKVPLGSLHPKRVIKGVVSGVGDYGNKMGIPTVNGAVLFHKDFVSNPLVYCGTVGIMPKDKSFKQVFVGDLIVVVGGRTGRDGIHGATFSSGELTHESETVSSGAVQIGNPIQEKKVLDTLLQARDKNLFTALTDCGAGGLSSAIGEMGSEIGAKVYLDKVPLKYSGLSYMEIWISESQERMVLSVRKENVAELISVFESEFVEATVIGEFTNNKKLELYYRDQIVCSLDMPFLHEGIPQIVKKAFFAQTKHAEPKIACKKDLTPQLVKLLSHYDICSKEWIIRQYDHEVQGGSILKPLVGLVNDGPSDASVVQPLADSKKGVIVSNGINFHFGFIDPYWMAASCIDEAMRQIICVGGSLKETAILDNFCWGNPDKPDRLGALVRCAYGCYDTAKAYGVPFISGKDSFYNEFNVHGKSTPIPGTLLISAISVMEDISKTVSMYAKQAGNLVYVVGCTSDELGGSHYFDLYNAIGNKVPKVNFARAKKIFSCLSKATEKGLVRSMHDCSDGGLAVALAEMAFSGGLGMDVFLSEVPHDLTGKELRDDTLLFSESNSRFVVEVDKYKQKEFEKQLKGLEFGLLGCVRKEKIFNVHGLDSKVCISADIDSLKDAWQKPLKW